MPRYGSAEEKGKRPESNAESLREGASCPKFSRDRGPGGSQKARRPMAGMSQLIGVSQKSL